MKQHELFGGPPEAGPAKTEIEVGAEPELAAEEARREAPGEGSPEPEAGPDRTPPTPGPGPGPAPSGDARERARAATEFERPLLLRAGAGTGKTATLVARVAHWCLGPGWELEAPKAERGGSETREARAARVLRGVAAVTFTEAAAAEMSTRVGLALAAVQGFSAGRCDLPVGFVRAALPEDAAELGARAEALRSTLDHLNVSTIHAFCRRILAAHALDANLDPSFEVDATFQQAELAVRDAIEELLRADWEAGDDSDWIALAQRGITPPDVEATVVGLVTDQGARAADLAPDPLPEPDCVRLLGELRARTAELRSLAGALDAFRTKASSLTGLALECLDDTALALEAPAPPGSDGGGDRAAFAALAGRLTAIWDEGEGGKAWKRVRDWGQKLNKGEGEAISDHAAFQGAAAAFRRVALPFLEIDIELLELGRRVIGRVLARVEALLRHRGVATFSDLLSSTRLLLSDPQVAARERARMRQLLVDEFQDTDLEQCEIVAALALEGEQRPGLFLVGDPKQSIFAWRNADLGAFDDFSARLEAEGGEVLSLRANYRSHEQILAEVERLVDPVMEQIHGLQPAFEALEPARAGARASLAAPAVEHWISWPRDPITGEVAVGEVGNKEATYSSEARAIARDVLAQRAEGDPWKDFAVIVRSMTGIDLYLRELREAGVPYEVQSDRKYYERREVIDAASLVRTLLDPTDHVALLGFLRSPAVGLPDAALFALWEAGFPGELIRLTRPEEQRLAKLDALIDAAAGKVPEDVPGLQAIAGWEESVKAAVRAVAELRASFGRDAVDRFVERVRELLMTDVAEAARYLGEYRLANLERFFRDLVRALEEADGDARRVLRALRANVGRTDRTEASRPTDSGRDAVQVLTIHGSKGLQFPTVYLAQTHRRPRPDDRSEPGFERRGGAAAYRLFGAPSLSWVEREEWRAEVEAAERVRLLYVTLTRAERRLVILGAWSEKHEVKPWRRADTANALCRSRAGAGEALAAVAGALRAGRFESHIDDFGVAWRLAELELSSGRAPELRSLEVATQQVDAIIDEAGALAVDRRRAERRMLRPFSSAASAEAHLEALELSAARRFAPPDGRSEAGPLGRDAAMASGTAIHRLLEDLELSGDVLANWSRGAERLGDLVARLAPEEQREVALGRARELFERIACGGLLERLAAIGAEGLVARELHLLAPGGGDESGPVGFVSGAVDLVYREPGSGALVVADYKTDRAEGDEALAALAAGYRAQGAVYTSSLRAALGEETEPRFELWFLHAGRVLTP